MVNAIFTVTPGYLTKYSMMYTILTPVYVSWNQSISKYVMVNTILTPG